MTNFLLRISGCVLLVLGLVLLPQDPAAAAVVIEVDPPAAPPGATVIARAVERSLVLIPSGRLEIFLAPSQRAADTARGPEDARLIRVGELVANGQCGGRLSFTVPHVAAGEYVLAAHCAECTRGMIFPSTCTPDPELAEQASGPGTMITVGRFTVTGGSALPRTGDSPLPGIAFAIVLASIGIGILAGSRSRMPQF
jgi:hypothetical protein